VGRQVPTGGSQYRLTPPATTDLQIIGTTTPNARQRTAVPSRPPWRTFRWS